MPKLKMDFNEKPIFFKEVIDKSDTKRGITDMEYDLWEKRLPKEYRLWDTNMRLYGKNSGFTRQFVRSDDVCHTLTTTSYIVADFPRYLNEAEIKKCSSFPMDYKYPSREKLQWMCGMSVPPVMTAQIAHQVYLQWLKGL